MSETKKKWRDIGSSADLERVKVGTKIRHRQTGQEFVVVKVGDMVDGVLQIEARPTTVPMTFEHRDGKWEFT